MGFNNRWQKILPKKIIQKINKNLHEELIDLGYKIENE